MSVEDDKTNSDNGENETSELSLGTSIGEDVQTTSRQFDSILVSAESLSNTLTQLKNIVPGKRFKNK